MRREDDLESRGARAAIDRRGFLKLFGAAGAAGALAPLLAACGSGTGSGQRSQVLRVGLVFPDSGPLKEIGAEMLAGFTAYLTVSNQRIGGMNTTITSIDEGSAVKDGVTAVRNALKSGSYDVLVGIANSAVLGQVPADVTTAQMPLLATAGAPVSMMNSQYLWRVAYTAGEAGAALGAYVGSLEGGAASSGVFPRPKSVVIYDDGSSDAVAETTAFTAKLANSANPGDPSIKTWFARGGITSPTLANAVSDKNPDLVFASVAIASSTTFVSEYRSRNIHVPLIGPGVMTEQSTLPSNFRGIYTGMNYASGLSNAANETFSSAYLNQTNGKVPTAFAMAAYDAALVLDSALTALPVTNATLSPSDINSAIYKVQSFNSPRGQWEFNQEGSPLQQWYLRCVQNDGHVLGNIVLDNLKTLT